MFSANKLLFARKEKFICLTFCSSGKIYLSGCTNEDVKYDYATSMWQDLGAISVATLYGVVGGVWHQVFILLHSSL